MNTHLGLSDSLPPRFDISIYGSWTLEVADIWPDGDAPENPTVQDVRDRLPVVRNLISEWNLVPDVEVDVRA